MERSPMSEEVEESCPSRSFCDDRTRFSQGARGAIAMIDHFSIPYRTRSDATNGVNLCRQSCPHSSSSLLAENQFR